MLDREIRVNVRPKSIFFRLAPGYRLGLVGFFVMVFFVASWVAEKTPSVIAQDWEIRKKTTKSAATKKGGSPNTKKSSSQAKKPGVQMVTSPRSDANISRDIRAYVDRVGKNPADSFALRRLVEEAQLAGGVGVILQDLERQIQNNHDDVRSLTVAGAVYKVTGNADKAIEYLKRAATLAPRNPQIHELFAEVLANQQRWEDALNVLETAAQSAGSASFELYKKAAETAFVGGFADRAKGLAARALERDRSKFARMEIAELFRNWGALAEALALWQQIGVDEKDNYTQMMVLREAAALLLDLGNENQAAAMLRRGLAKVRRGTGDDRELRELLVGVYRRSARLPELLQEYQPQIGKDYEITALCGRLYEELGDDSMAQATYREALRLRPKAVEMRQALIGLLERQGAVDEVIEQTQLLIQQMRKDPQLEVRLAELHARKGDKKQATEILRRTASRYPRDPAVQGMIMDQYVRLGVSGDLVLQQLLTLRRLEPREEAHVLGLGEYYYSNGKRDLALATWLKLLEIVPKKATAHVLLATTLAQHQRNDLADQHFKDAVAADPADEKIRRKYSEFLVKQRKFDAAAQQWIHVLELAGDDRRKANKARTAIVEIWNNSGMLRHKQQELRRRFDTKTNLLLDGRLLVATYLVEHAYAKAEQVLSQILENHPEDLDSLLALEWVFARTNRIDEARELALRLSEMDAANKPEHLARYAEYAVRAGDTDSAIHVSSQLVELNPTDARAQANVGDILWQQGDIDGAIRQYRRAVDLGGRDYAIHLRLATVYHERGLVDDELLLLRKVVEHADDSPTIMQAGQRLLQAAGLMGKLDRMEDGLLALVQQWPDRPVYRTLLVDLYRQLGHALTLAVQKDPTDAGTRQKLAGLVDRGLVHLVAALQDDVSTRSKVLEILKNTRSPNVALPLLRLLDDPDREIRAQAAIAVAFGGADAAVVGLTRLVDSTDIHLRPIGVWALGTLKTPSSFSKLAEVALSHGSPDLRALACLALGVRGLPDAVPVLRKALSSTVDRISANAAWGLGMIGLPEVVPDIARLITHSSPDVVHAALWSLGNLGGPVAQQALLRHLLFSDEPMIDVALAGLLRTGVLPDSPASSNELFAWKAGIREAYLQLANFELARLNDQVSVKTLMGFAVRSATMQGELETAISTMAVSILAELISTSDQMLLGQAIDRLIGGNGSPAIEPIYLPPLDGGPDSFAEARVSLHMALKPLGPKMVSLLGSARPTLRSKIHKFIGKVASPTDDWFRQAVLDGMKDADAVVQRAAIQAAGWIKDGNLTDAVIEMGSRISPVNFAVQATWAEAVAGLGDRRPIPILVGWLRSDFPTVRVQVLNALGELGDASLVPELLLATEDVEPRAKDAALIALGKVGDRSALAALQAMTKHCAAENCERIADTIRKISAR